MYEMNEWLLFALTILLFYASSEIGFRLGRRAGKGLGEEAYPHVATIEGALLGLLALLLGFAFSMAMSRYDSRRQVVVAEANDLQTTFLRSKLLPSARRHEIGILLKEYVDSRISYLQAGRDTALIRQALDLTVKLQDKLWNAALAVAEENSDEVRTGYFIESLNGLIDDHSRRLTAMESHVPDVIFILLLFVGAMTLAMTGYSSGFNEHRLIVPRLILIVLTAATLLVIVDLDRPRRGLITVSERSLVDLKAQLDRDSSLLSWMNTKT